MYVTYDVIIVGAGAAGVFTAGQLRAMAPHLRVCLLEATHQPLTKVKISGGGRCNVTHHCMEPKTLSGHYPRGGAWLKPLLYQFGPSHMLTWLEQHGVTLKTETDGRMFPVTDDSQTIVNALMGALGSIPIHTGNRLTSMQRQPDDSWQLTTLGTSADKPPIQWHARHVVITTGGSPALWSLLAKAGQPIMSHVPSLFTFTVNAPWLTELPGVSVPDVVLKLPGHKTVPAQQGPLLMTHWGISGPVTLRLSAFAAVALAACQYQTMVQVDWLPAVTWDDCRHALLTYKQQYPTRQISGHPVWPLPRQLWKALTDTVFSGQWAHIDKSGIHHLVTQLKQCPLPMTGKGVFKDEFVLAGGVDVKGIHPKTLESAHLPGVYFAGEVLNVDGITGGFNFQNAWTTGYTVAKALSAL